ncbi:Ephrin-A4 [Bagarius yarrelli]|uniref:Ephrin-A4 n=1 Tax=Bagarius yarrelli TaxID=175774 RepID=A0A556V936_BAGYA|nr:Ephrin-A4 [Bagarius yarrelli]
MRDLLNVGAVPVHGVPARARQVKVRTGERKQKKRERGERHNPFFSKFSFFLSFSFYISLPLSFRLGPVAACPVTHSTDPTSRSRKKIRQSKARATQRTRLNCADGDARGLSMCMRRPNLKLTPPASSSFLSFFQSFFLSDDFALFTFSRGLMPLRHLCLKSRHDGPGLAFLVFFCSSVGPSAALTFSGTCARTHILTSGDYSVEVDLNDYLDILCPHYPSGPPPPGPPETLSLYLVAEHQFQGCHETKGAIKRWECNSPYAPFGPVRFSEKIQRFTPFSLGFEFLPGHHYYYSCE